jgi:hypothetical protein
MEHGQVVELLEPRVREAYALRLSGLSWDQVARELDYASADSVRLCVNGYINRINAEVDQSQRIELLHTELDRLGALQAAVWPAAMAGDTRAVDVALRVSDRRIKLLRLDQPQEDDVTGNTLVITSENFTTALHELIDEQEAAKLQRKTIGVTQVV